MVVLIEIPFESLVDVEDILHPALRQGLACLQIGANDGAQPQLLWLSRQDYVHLAQPASQISRRLGAADPTRGCPVRKDLS